MPKEKLVSRNFITVLAVMMVANIGYSMMMPIITPYVVSIGFPIAVAGVVTGTMMIVAMCVRPFTGIIGDLMNKKILLILSSSLTVFALFGYTITTSLPGLIAFRVLHGIGFSMTSTISLVISGESVPASRMGEGFGYFGVAQGVTTAIGPNLGLSIANRIGYRGALQIAVVFALLGVAMVLLLKVKPRQHELPKFNFTYFRKNLFAKEIFPFILINFALGSYGGLESSFLALYTMELGYANVGWYFTVNAVILIVVKFALGRVSDKYSFSSVLVFGSAMLSIALFLLGTLRLNAIVPMLIITAVVRSLGMGILQPALQSTSLKAVPEHRRSAASSTFYLQTDLGYGSAPMIGGAMEKNLGYSGTYLAYILPFIASVLVYFGITLKKKKRKEALGQNEAS